MAGDGRAVVSQQSTIGQLAIPPEPDVRLHVGGAVPIVVYSQVRHDVTAHAIHRCLSNDLADPRMFDDYAGFHPDQVTIRGQIIAAVSII